MYETLINKLETTLNDITRVKEYFSYPKNKLTKYPAVMLFPAGYENLFETNQENYKIYNFNLIVIVGVPQTDMENAASVLQKTIDDIISKFDTDWDQGTIDGHRVWVNLNAGDPWQLSEENDSLELYASLNLEVKMLGDI